MDNHIPSYVALLESGELARRVNHLIHALADCEICPHRCGVNRLKGERGACQTERYAVVSSAGPHYGEEDVLVGAYGSGTIFFSNCNLKCVFCQNYEVSHCGEGNRVTSERLAEAMLQLQDIKCANINLVSPGHIVPQIVEAIYLAAQKGLRIPIVYNTNSYDLVSTLRMLDGIVDIYMPDIKFSDDEAAQEYLGVKDYYSIAKDAVLEMHRQVGDLKTDDRNVAYRGLLIRHLVMPQNIAGTEKIMRFIADEVSEDTYVNLMAQYYPAYKAFDYPELSKSLSRRDYQKAVKDAESTGLTRCHHTNS